MSIHNEHIIEMTGICKDFSGVRVLHSVDLQIEEGKVHGLIGGNGAGKSTLCRVLAGSLPREAGEIKFKGEPVVGIWNVRRALQYGIGMVHQEAELAPELTVAENIMLGKDLSFVINYPELHRQTKELLDRLRFDLDPQLAVKHLGVHEKQLVEIAKAISLDTKVILMDEPSAALSKGEVNHLFGVIKELKSQGFAILYVSHRMDEILDISDRVTVLRGGEKVGDFSSGEITLEKLVEAMVGHKLEVTTTRGNRGKEGAVVLSLQHVSFPPEVSDVNLSLREGEILGVGGLPGSGISELAKVMFGALPAKSGEMYVYDRKVTFHSPEDAMKCGIGFVPRDRKGEGLIPRLPLGQNITVASLSKLVRLKLIIKGFLERAAIKEQISRLNISPPEANKIVEEFSGGNQQKAVLAKWLVTKYKILILDEPTVGVDVPTREQLYSIMGELADKEGLSLVLMSADMSELMRVCDRVVIILRGRITAELPADRTMEGEALRLASLDEQEW